MNPLIQKFPRRARRTLHIVVAWSLVAVLMALQESIWGRMHGVVSDLTPILVDHLRRATISGLLIGGAYIYFFHDRSRKMPFLTAFSVVALFLAIPAIITGSIMHPVEPGWEWMLIWQYGSGCILMGATMLILRLNDQYGGGDAGHLLGRHRKPRQELRIFMFLDMRSSTSVAEAIGDTRYFQLLDDLYADITDPVIYSEGNIYQYVGDEISVSWPLNKGIRNDRCIRCFFAIREKLRKRAPYYEKKYGIKPVFKAGFHYGRVTTGEVGMAKKQTIFSGDVVNTAAHIQSSCNELGVDNLVSKQLLDILSLRPSRYVVRPIGSIPLKGKRNTVDLFTISLAGAGQ